MARLIAVWPIYIYIYWQATGSPGNKAVDTVKTPRIRTPFRDRKSVV